MVTQETCYPGRGWSSGLCAINQYQLEYSHNSKLKSRHGYYFKKWINEFFKYICKAALHFSNYLRRKWLH